MANPSSTSTVEHHEEHSFNGLVDAKLRPLGVDIEIRFRAGGPLPWEFFPHATRGGKKFGAIPLRAWKRFATREEALRHAALYVVAARARAEKVAIREWGSEAKLVAAAARRSEKETEMKRNAKSGPANQAEANELILTTENESSLYPQFRAIEQNLLRKIKSGKYDHSLAWKAWMYWIDAGAKHYAKHYGGSFNKNTRELAAKQVSDGWLDAMRAEGVAKNSRRKRTSRGVRRNSYLGGPYELVYSTGGHGGPYRTLVEAEDRADKLMRGSASEQWIAVVPAREVPTMRAGSTPVERIRWRDRGWSGRGTLPRLVANKRKRTSRRRSISRNARAHNTWNQAWADALKKANQSGVSAHMGHVQDHGFVVWTGPVAPAGVTGVQAVQPTKAFAAKLGSVRRRTSRRARRTSRRAA